MCDYHESWSELFNKYKFNIDNLYANNIPHSLVNIFSELKAEYPERNYKFTSGNFAKAKN
jgi:hypothetical protein